ncbi:MAG: sodium/hydrogen antiporter [Planctomycetota bacterium]|nr:MAG: sodium/hydrogen antiporter [Planctomycetota bacterium]
MSADPLYILAGLALAGVVAQALAARLHLPSIVFLLAIGLAVGPGTGLINPNDLFGTLLGPFVSLSVALVLFEGGLSLKWSEARKLGAPLWRLVIGGLLLSFSLTFGFALLAGLSLPTAGVIAAILVVTGPTVIKPMLRQARLNQRPARLLRWEGIVNDPFGALLAVVVVELALLHAQEPDAALAASLLPIGWRVLVAGGAGGALGWLLGLALKRAWVPQHLKIPAIVAGVLATFAGAEALFHEAGLLAVTAMGVVLANAASQSIETIRHFKEEVATLLVAFLFLVLAANLSRADLLAFTPGSVMLVLAILFVVRPASVWLSLAGSGLSWQEKLLVGWIAPRGIVAAAMAGVLAPQVAEAGYEDARLILPVIFGVILLTVLLHGFTVAPLARKLGLAGAREGGLLLVGLSSWAQDLARAVQQAGGDVLCVDADRRQTARARLDGLPSEWADVLVEDDLDELPLERMRWLLAASPDDHFNQLVCLALGKTLGSDLVLQLSPRSEGRGERDSGLGGRTPWGELGTYDEISARYWKGARFKVTELTEQFNGDDFRAKNPEALVLFEVVNARLEPVRSDDDVEPGGKLIWLP